MKKVILLFIIVISSFNFCPAQEWFSSLEVAGKLALAQDKMLFVMWEDSFNFSYLVYMEDGKGNKNLIDITEDTSFDSIIWKYFVPVKINESKFAELSDQIQETRGLRYYNKLVDDSIKIMDVNGNILNINTNEAGYENLSLIITKYALNTSYLKQALSNYAKEATYTTSFRLAFKYLDYAVFMGKDTRYDLIQLADIYLNEAKNHLSESEIRSKTALLQKCDLLKQKEYLILNRPRKVLRHLKKLEVTNIDAMNESLFSFLYYTAFKLIKDEGSAALWKSKVSLVDLKKQN